MKNTTNTYVFIFEDRDKNELTRREAECNSIKEARKIAKLYYVNSNLNDLHKIVVKKRWSLF